MANIYRRIEGDLVKKKKKLLVFNEFEDREEFELFNYHCDDIFFLHTIYTHSPNINVSKRVSPNKHLYYDMVIIN